MSKIVRRPDQNLIELILPKKISRVLVLADIHAPHVCLPAWRAILDYAADNREYGAAVVLGDWGDFESISSHNRGKLGNIEGLRVSRDIEAVERSIIELDSAVGPNCPIFYIQGNHEYRVVRFLEEHPELKGIPDFDLERRFGDYVTWVPFWSRGTLLKIGRMYFAHGRRTGSGHTMRNLRDYEVNLMTGHSHAFEVSGKPIASTTDYRISVSLGGLQTPGIPWMQGRPSAWVPMFGELLYLPDGTFTMYTPVVINGRFVTQSGKLYSGNRNDGKRGKK